jgi:hypothetical protein
LLKLGNDYSILPQLGAKAFVGDLGSNLREGYSSKSDSGSEVASASRSPSSISKSLL